MCIDTLIIVEGSSSQLLHLKDLLSEYATSTGLKVNFSKSMLVPINMEINRTSQTFGCTVGSLPFTYLGLPLGLSKPKIEEFLPLVSRCERRLLSTSTFLSQAGKLQMTNAVFTSIPMFFCVPSFYKKLLLSKWTNTGNFAYEMEVNEKNHPKQLGR